MNMNQLIKTAFDGVKKVKVATLCIVMAVFAAGCGTSTDMNSGDDETQTIKLEDGEENPIETDNGDEFDDMDFCSCLNVENFGKTIPFINEWLGSSQYAWNLWALPEFLTSSYPCINNAKVVSVKSGTGTSEVLLTFEESGITKNFILEISGNSAIGTNPLKVEGYYEYSYRCNLCVDFDIENIENSIPVINEFLSALPDILSGEQKIKELEKWLNIHFCIAVASVEHYSAVKTNPPTGEIIIRAMDGRGVLRAYYMDVQWTSPMTVTGFHNPFYTHENTEEPVEVTSTEYSLEETSCKWNLNLDERGRNLIVINSYEVLENHIICTGSDYPAIDFTKYTLLLAYGNESGLYIQSPVYLHWFSTGYVLNADFLASDAAVMNPWQSAIIVDKLPEESNIELLYNYVNFR